jgi:hypothetical protein
MSISSSDPSGRSRAFQLVWKSGDKVPLEALGGVVHRERRL